MFALVLSAYIFSKLQSSNLFLIMTFSVVVSTLLDFVRMFNKAYEENCKQQELDKKKAEKEATSEQTNNSHKGAEASIVK